MAYRSRLPLCRVRLRVCPQIRVTNEPGRCANVDVITVSLVRTKNRSTHETENSVDLYRETTREVNETAHAIKTILTDKKGRNMSGPELAGMMQCYEYQM